MVALKAGSGERGAVLRGPRAVALVLALTWGVFLGVLHPSVMNWGATADERQLRLPGDDPAADSSASLTRAITIEAPRASVWPWLVQVGQDRAGFYSYTWLENLTGADIHNADEVHAEWQQRAVGDKVPMAGAPLRRSGCRVGRRSRCGTGGLSRGRDHGNRWPRARSPLVGVLSPGRHCRAPGPAGPGRLRGLRAAVPRGPVHCRRCLQHPRSMRRHIDSYLHWIA
jgi:hypothetical protein